MYYDYSMKHNWKYGIKTLRVDGRNVAGNGRNSVQLSATLPNDGKIKADVLGGLDLKRQDSRLDLKMTGVHLEDFSDLCRNYTGYPLDGGLLALESHMDVTGGKLSGNNIIEIDHPRVGRKERFSKAPYKNIPVRAGMNLLTSAQDMILLEVPVSGDATNPKFNFQKVISRALLKVFFGPLMGTKDRDKSITKEELQQMQELLEEDTVSLGEDASGQVSADVAMTARDSVGLTEVSQ